MLSDVEKQMVSIQRMFKIEEIPQEKLTADPIDNEYSNKEMWPS